MLRIWSLYFNIYCSFTFIRIISSKVSLIGDYAFKSTKITALTLPDKLDLIGKQAFYSCTNLAGDIQIGASKIGDSAFEGCNRILVHLIA